MSTNGPDPQAHRRKVLQWIAVAEADRVAADLCLGTVSAVAAYHCQQAAEKLLKGFLVSANIDFRKTHDLKELGQAVVAQFADIGALVRPIERWTEWNFAYRYPAEQRPEPEPTSEELRRALQALDALAARLRAVAAAMPRA